jgi:hypothetical protein
VTIVRVIGCRFLFTLPAAVVGSLRLDKHSQQCMRVQTDKGPLAYRVANQSGLATQVVVDRVVGRHRREGTHCRCLRAFKVGFKEPEPAPAPQLLRQQWWQPNDGLYRRQTLSGARTRLLRYRRPEMEEVTATNDTKQVPGERVKGARNTVRGVYKGNCRAYLRLARISENQSQFQTSLPSSNDPPAPPTFEQPSMYSSTSTLDPSPQPQTGHFSSCWYAAHTQALP